MSIKKIIAVIFLAILTGVVIFLGSNLLSESKIIDPSGKKGGLFAKSTPTPIPTPIPVNETTDLKSEIKSLIPTDYSDQIDQLKQ